jgi:hypothetical protein
MKNVLVQFSPSFKQSTAPKNLCFLQRCIDNDADVVTDIRRFRADRAADDSVRDAGCWVMGIRGLDRAVGRYQNLEPFKIFSNLS